MSIREKIRLIAGAPLSYILFLLSDWRKSKQQEKKETEISINSCTKKYKIGKIFARQRIDR